MPRFSLIVPVYNVELYLERCLNSIINQSFKDFEVIVVNDGSKDNSENIIEQFCSKYKFITKFNKQNGGLSDARNYGIEKAIGEYLLFIDSDDYISDNLLFTLDNIINAKKYDLIKFGYDLVYNDKTVCLKDEIIFNKQYNGDDFFCEIVKQNKPFEMAWIYCYKKSFWDKNKFSFEIGKYHEDLGLTPRVILKAESIYCIDYIGYHYVQMGDSITRNNNYEKTFKRVYDILYHFDNLYEIINRDKSILLNTKKIVNSYLANATISKINDLNKADKKKYIRKLKQRKVFDLLIDDNIGRKLKKLFYKIKYFRN